ncbi:MAG: iron ABC transporter permease [Spirochaetaceae bacterium]|nr:iron ABC transporter permease [Spirochaetaceae bacterium]
MSSKKINSTSLIISVTLVLLVVVIVYPLSRIIFQSLKYNEAFSFQNYLGAVKQNDFFISLLHSIEIAVIAMIGATLIGSFLAWIIGRTDIPWKNFFRTAFIIPFIIPPFIGALAWKQLLGPVGIFNKLLMNITGSNEPLWNIYGADGIIAVLIIHIYPLVYINMLGNLERMNPELEEAAQISGSRIFSVMRKITLPLMLPSIASSAVLVFIMSIANFGIPAVLGFSENFYVLTTKIYEAITQSSQANSLSLGAALSVLLGIIAGSGLLFQRFYIRKKEYSVLTGKSMQPNIVVLGKHKYWMFSLCILFITVTSIAPLISITLTALTKVYGLPPVPSNWTLRNFYDVFVTNSTLKRAIRNSLFLAFSAATLISILGSVIAYIVVKTKVKGRFLLELISNLPYALPGTVVAVGMILAWLKPVPIFGFRLYNTIWILLVAYIARYMAFGVRTTTTSLTQIHQSLEEIARISGASWFQTFKDIIIPLILPGLFAGWFLVFMPALRELTISALLWSTRHETIGVMVFNLQESGNTVASAALSVVMLIVLVIANIIVRKITKGKMGY